MERHHFLQSVLPSGNYYVTATLIFGTKKIHHTTHGSIAAMSQRNFPDDVQSYFAPASFCASTYVGVGGKKVPRNRENVQNIACLWADFDPRVAADGSQIVSQQDILSVLLAFQLKPTIIVDTGRGIQAFWKLPAEVNGHQWNMYADGLRAMLLAHGEAILGEDTSQWCNSAALMRMPGTINQKTGRTVTVLPSSGASLTYDDLALILTNVTTVKAADASGSSAVYDNAQKVAYHTLLTECQALHAMASNPDEVPEPAWYAALGCLHAVHDGEEAAVEFSKGYTGFDEAETRLKFRQWSAAVNGYTRCRTLASLAPTIAARTCQHCKKYDKDRSPIYMLPRSEHKPAIEIKDALSAAFNRNAVFDNLPTATFPVIGNGALKIQLPQTENVTRLDEWVRHDKSRYEVACEIIASTGVFYVANRGLVPIVYTKAAGAGQEPILVFEGAVPLINERRVDITGACKDVIFGIHMFKEHDGTEYDERFTPIQVLQDRNKVCSEFAASVLGTNVAHSQQFARLMSLLLAHASRRKDLQLSYNSPTFGWVKRPTTATSKTLPPFVTINGVVIEKGKMTKADVSAINEGSVPQYDATDPVALQEIFAEWQEANQPWVNMTAGMVAFAASLASPTLAIINAKPMTIHIQGAAGTFKTTAAEAAVSVWSHKINSVRNINSSTVAITSTALRQRSLPFVVDEVTNIDPPRRLADMIEQHNLGQEKTRLNTAGTLVMSRNNEFCNIMITTANASVGDKLKQAIGVNPETTKRKYLEVEVPEGEATAEDMIEFAMYADSVNQYAWGSAGVLFMRSIADNLEAYLSLYETHRARVDGGVIDVKTTLNNQKTLIAAMLTAADWSTRTGILTFDLDRLYNILVTSLYAQATDSGCMAAFDTSSLDRTARQIIAFVSGRKNNRIAHVSLLSEGLRVKAIKVISYFPVRGNETPLVLYVYPTQDTFQLNPDAVVEPLCVMIEKNTVKELASQLGYNASSWMKANNELLDTIGFDVKGKANLNVSTVAQRTDSNPASPNNSYTVNTMPISAGGTEWVIVPFTNVTGCDNT